MNCRLACAIALSCGVSAIPAAAQRLPFERAFDVSGPVDLDVSTVRGKIAVTAGDGSHVVVRGTVTVRTGFDVPGDALAIAQRLAKTPPIDRDGDTIRLRPPGDPRDQRAVTIAYEVRMPPPSWT